nr:organic cation transporter protein-like [Procambarus clarkii]
MSITNFDSVFEFVGGFGPYQMILFAVECITCLFFTFVYCGQIFMTLTPPHWCRTPADLDLNLTIDLNLTQDEVKELTIPRDETTGKYLQCVMYDVDFSEIVMNNSSWPNSSWPTTSCTNGWTYDYSLYYPTITSQLDWVCDDDWRPTVCQSVFFLGSLLITPFFGWAADKWGRLPIIVFTNVLGGVAGVISAFCTSFVTFAVSRFIVGMTFDTQFMVTFVLLLEYVSSEYRTVVSHIPVAFFLTLSMAAIPWLALAIADWSTFAVIIHAPQLISIIFIWLLPESARWLINQGRIKDTLKILQRVAKLNKKTLSPEFIEDFNVYGASQQTKEGEANTIDLLKTPVLRQRLVILCICWMVCALAYDGHMRNTQNIGNNTFVSFSLGGLVEVPADLLTIMLLEKIGRRYSTVLSLILGGLASCVIATIPEANTAGVVGVAMVGRFLITIAMNSGQQYPVEVLPTVARGSGVSTIHTLGFLTFFASPYVVYLAKYGYYLPYVILGIVSVAGGLVCIVLPETLDQILPDTLEDGETFLTNQSLCYNPCARKRSESKEILSK